MPGAHPGSYKTDEGFIPVPTTTHPHIAPRLKKKQSSTSPPPLGLHDMLQVEICLTYYYFITTIVIVIIIIVTGSGSNNNDNSGSNSITVNLVF